MDAIVLRNLFSPLLAAALTVLLTACGPGTTPSADATLTPDSASPSPSEAAAHLPAGLTVTDAWSRATPGADTASVYLTLRNGGPGDDVLRSATTPVSAAVSLHRTDIEQGIARMRPVAELPIQAGEILRAEPGALHVMLEGLHQPLVEGESFELTLAFRDADAVSVQVAVRGLTAGAPEPEHQHESGHDHAHEPSPAHDSGHAH